jgi:hypothetical protein
MNAARVPPTTSVHDALSRAQQSHRDRICLKNANFKADPLKKEIAEGICAGHGTTLSAFLRECLDGLVRDYVGPKTMEKLESSGG